jgi:secreted trypsin-like serine protease
MIFRVAKIAIKALVIILIWPSMGHAINGGVRGSSEIAAQTIMITSTRGAYCSGTVIARDLILTAAHCVAPRSEYAVAINGVADLISVKRIVIHPKYNPHQFETRIPSPDLAILKLAEPLPARYRAAKLSTEKVLPKRGETFVLAGFGFARDGDENSLGTLRSVALPSVGTTGGIMVRVSAGNGAIKGACTGDSGGSAFHNGKLAGVIGWTSIPEGKNCGFTTGLTMVGLQRTWIEEIMRDFGFPTPN